MAFISKVNPTQDTNGISRVKARIPGMTSGVEDGSVGFSGQVSPSFDPPRVDDLFLCF